MLFNGLKDRMRVQLDVAHHRGEHVPLNLCERQKQMLVGEQCLLAAARFLDGPVDDALGGFANLAR